jgi:lipoprotein NlpD
MAIEAGRWSMTALRCGAAGLLLALVGCSTSLNRAPVEDRMAAGRGSSNSASTAPAAAASTAPVAPGLATAMPADATKPLPGIENLGKPGYYAVKPGDTLIRIGLESGQNWKDLVKWNNLENPNVIEVGQVVRVVPPGTDASTAATRPIAGAKAEPVPGAKPAAGAASGASAPATTVVASAAPTPPVAPVAPPPVTKEGDEDVNWSWPAAGSVFAGFEEGKAKGLVISGKAGDPVFAAADGRVVYAGSGLRGYGNLVILKHNNTYLTAYAHNQTLLVKEDQAVRRGQKIAEMGSSDAERVQLHFEIRKQGKPIDPAKLLPPR